jgi:hypothetical protein
MQNVTPDIMTALNKGIQAGQAIRQAPIIEAMQKQRLEQERQQMQGRSNIQQAVAIPGVGFQTLTRGGQVGIQTLTPEQQALFKKAADEEAERAARAAGLKSGTTEREKLNVQKDIKPEISRAVKTAEIEAVARGETATQLNKSKAALPGLNQVVSNLKDLAPLATSTIGGKFFDKASKELGFGATKGSTARVKYEGLINNQILPLLRQTFGAAFTQADRESLQTTMGDPDLAPGEKMAVLDVFIQQKMREIETKERELSPATNDGGQEEIDALRAELGL